MPKFRVGIYRHEYFVYNIEAEDSEDAATQMTSDSDVVHELMHDHPEDISNGYWELDFVEEL